MAGGGRVEIDTRPPFRSVKEAVALFGEKIVGEIYANKIKEVSKDTKPGRIKSLESELQETKQSLEKTRDENEALREELEHAKSRIEQLKPRKEERLVKFASPPSLTRVMTTKEEPRERPHDKKKAPVRLLRWMFPRKKDEDEKS